MEEVSNASPRLILGLALGPSTSILGMFISLSFILSLILFPTEMEEDKWDVWALAHLTCKKLAEADKYLSQGWENYGSGIMVLGNAGFFRLSDSVCGFSVLYLEEVGL